jgi:hypothetical protein
VEVIKETRKGKSKRKHKLEKKKKEEATSGFFPC